MDNQRQQQQAAAEEEFQEPQPSSPRRGRPTLDLDAALYLQSQASYVQAPNSPTVKSGGGGGGGNTASSAHFGGLPLAPAARLVQQQQQQQQRVISSATDTSNASSSATNAASTRKASLLDLRRQSNAAFVIGDSSTGAAVGAAAASRGAQSSVATSNPIRANKQQNPYYRQYYHSSNNSISVDYIDCVSNDDLQPTVQASLTSISAAGGPTAGLQSATIGRSTMKCIPRCRKHLRFHRNRVDPSSPGSQDTTTTTQRSSMQQQGEQRQGSSASANNQQPDVGASDSLDTLDHELGQAAAAAGSNGLATAGLVGVGSAPTTSGSVLYPISVDEVKKRTYFIGSVSQDSLLGHDELFRYFPNGKVSIFVCTWNQNRKRAPTNLNDLLLPDQLIYMPDIYAIGIQEAFSSQADHIKEWEIELQTTLGPNHVLLHSCSLGVLHLALFVRRDLIWFCSTPEESVYNSRSMPTNMINTKGAVSIAFRFFGTSFMFTNCHFPAHEHRLNDRIDEYRRIINSIDLPKNLKLLKPRYLSNDSTARFDCAFFMGDLNFRLEQRTFDETIHILEDIFQQKEPSYEPLTQNDELLKVMETNQAFYGFDESPIKFPPTYKFLAQTNKYDRRTRRIPSYTDRILFRSKRQRHIQCLIYDWLPQLLSSDHKPVYCLFDVLVRPGREQNMVASLNAGLFQRAIYLEALKRRAEDPESMRDNGASGNLICSIS